MSSFRDLWDEFTVRVSRPPVWLPGTAMELGDIGVIDRRGYLRVSKLADHGIRFDIQDCSVPVEYDVNSSNASTHDFGMSVGTADPTAVVGSASAGLRASFTAGWGFVLRASAVQGKRIENVLEVENQIREKQAAERFWQKDWIYVQEVITADRAVLLISRSDGAHATVGGTASAGVGSFLQLMNAETNLGVLEQSALEQSFVTSQRAPLMWRGRWLRGLFHKRFVSRDDEPLPDELASETDLYEDFDDPAVFERDLDRTEGKAG